MPKINIQTLHFKASEALNKYIEEKAEKLFRMSDEIIRADITLYEGAAGNPENHWCEIQLSIPGDNLFVKKNSNHYEKSILDAVTALQKIIRRNKRK
jgi:ribosomal subunit interface protein